MFKMLLKNNNNMEAVYIDYSRLIVGDSSVFD